MEDGSACGEEQLDGVSFLSNVSGSGHRMCINSNNSLPQRVLIFHQGQEANPRCQGDPNYAPPDRQNS